MRLLSKDRPKEMSILLYDRGKKVRISSKDHGEKHEFCQRLVVKSADFDKKSRRKMQISSNHYGKKM